MPSYDEHLIDRIRALPFEWQLSDLSLSDLLRLARMVRDGDLLHIDAIPTPAQEAAE
jgi:hypothetical protein